MVFQARENIRIFELVSGKILALVTEFSPPPERQRLGGLLNGFSLSSYAGAQMPTT